MNGFSTKKTLANCRAPRKGIPVADPTPATITRNKLHAANDQPAHGCAEDHNYAFRHGRAASRIMGYVECDDFTLPRRPFMPAFTGADRYPVERGSAADTRHASPVTRHGLSLGTPGEARRDRSRRLEKRWHQACAIGVALCLALAALWFVNAPPTKHARATDTGAQYRAKAARLAVGQSRHELDSEGCLIWMHKDAAGPITHTAVSTHC